jgi:hypothetical protein
VILHESNSLILDDWPLAPIGQAERTDLLELLDDGCTGKATVIITQLPVDRRPDNWRPHACRRDLGHTRSAKWSYTASAPARKSCPLTRSRVYLNMHLREIHADPRALPAKVHPVRANAGTTRCYPSRTSLPSTGR